jgi:hypothetical protein
MVRYFPSVVNFILLFQNSVLHMDLAIIHRDLAYRHSLVYIDGNFLYDKLLVHMSKLEKINFCIDTACLSDTQMDLIIKSFRTRKTVHLSS